MQLSYHLSKTRGTAFVNDFTGFGVFTSPSDPLDASADDGPSDFDMRHRFSATAVWEPSTVTRHRRRPARCVNGWKLSSRLIASDGFRFNATTGQDTNGDTIFNDRPSGQSYNSFTLPGYVTVDLRLDRSIADRRTAGSSSSPRASTSRTGSTRPT